MIDWSTWRPGIVDLLTTLALDTGASEPTWDESKTPFTDPVSGLRMVLKVTNVAGYGQDDERRYEFDTLGGLMTEVLVGLRRVTLQVRFASNEAADDDWAFTYSEKVRTRLRRSSSLLALAAIDSGIVEIRPTVNFSAPNDGFIETIAVFELILSVAFEDRDTADASGWIETIELSALVKDPGSTLLPDPELNVTDVLIPPGI